jgi:hypothetical protein
MTRRGKKEIIRLDELSEDSDDSEDSKENGSIRMEDARGVAVVNALYPQRMKKNQSNTLSNKHIVYATGIFVLMTNPLTDKLITSAFPLSQSWLVLLIVKTVLFFLFMYSSTFLLKSKK